MPKILLINIGSNEGLFMAGFSGNIGDDARKNVSAIPHLLQKLADRLKGLPERVERIVFNSLIRPRFIPNLMPSPEQENGYPGDAYYTAYGARIGSTQTSISGDVLKAYDELVSKVNSEAQGVLKEALGDRVVFADLYGKCNDFDGKHYWGRGLTIPGYDKVLTNKPLTPIPFGYHGGFAGLDNMHPTVPGYALIADIVLDALGYRTIRTDKAAAYAADTLLNNLWGLPMIFASMELSLVGLSSVFRGSDKGNIARV